MQLRLGKRYQRAVQSSFAVDFFLSQAMRRSSARGPVVVRGVTIGPLRLRTLGDYAGMSPPGAAMDRSAGGDAS